MTDDYGPNSPYHPINFGGNRLLYLCDEAPMPEPESEEPMWRERIKARVTFAKTRTRVGAKIADTKTKIRYKRQATVVSVRMKVKNKKEHLTRQKQLRRRDLMNLKPWQLRELIMDMSHDWEKLNKIYNARADEYRWCRAYEQNQWMYNKNFKVLKLLGRYEARISNQGFSQENRIL